MKPRPTSLGMNLAKLSVYATKVGRFGGLFLLLSQAYAAAACLDPKIGVQAGVENNVWQEFARDGKRLVREEGKLPFAALDGQVSCNWGSLAVRGMLAQGTRGYSGVSSTGGALNTKSAIRNSDLMLTYSYEVHPRFEPFLSAGISRSKRDIQSAGPVLGYPEEFRMYPVKVGAKWRPFLFDDRLLLLAHVGTAYQPQVTARLPGRDLLTLNLGRTVSVGVSAELELAKMEQGQFLVAISWDSRRSEASSVGVVTRNGVARGVASQPRNELMQTQLSFLWRRSL